LYSTVNKSFDNGVLGALYDQNNKYSQYFLSQSCATNWDKVCELASKNLNPAINSIDPFKGSTPANTTIADITIRNTAIAKYGGFRTLGGSWEQLDPTDSTSPFVKVISEVPELMIDVNTIDQDPVMDKLLENDPITGRSPIKNIDLLLNIHKNMYYRQGVDLARTNTKIGKFLKSYLLK
jgi:hypothetical protein